MNELTHRLLGSTLIVLCIGLAVACSNSTSNDDADDSTNAELASAPSTLGESANSGSVGRAFETLFAPSTVDCSTIAYGACDAATKTEARSFSTSGGDTDPCTRGNAQGRRVFGSSVLTFSAAGCTKTTGDTVTRSLINHYIQRGLHGTKVIVYTGAGTVAGQTLADADLKDYAGVAHSGGTVLTVTSTGGTLAVNGIHRRALHPNGKYGFWHTLYTDAGSPLTLTTSGTSATVSGTLNVMHNRAQKKITETFSNVVFSAGCDHPTSGTVTFTNEAGTAVTVTYTSTCGTARLDGTSTELDVIQN